LEEEEDGEDFSTMVTIMDISINWR